jgi:hypothetical protein
VSKSGHSLRFISKAPPQILVDRHVRVKDLYGHWTVEGGVAPNVYVGHTAPSNKLLYPHLRKDAAYPVIHPGCSS